MAGTYQPLEGQTECKECRAGGFCANDAEDAATCDGGFVPCEIGTFNNMTGSYNNNSCLPCPLGTFFDALLVDLKHTTVLTRHPLMLNLYQFYHIGTYSDNKLGLEECFECPKGTYQNEQGKATCEICDAGKIQNKMGQSMCVQCPSGKIPDTSKSACLDCPKGTYSHAGDSECKECTPGSVQDQTGKSECKVCPSGTFPDPYKVTCVDCPYLLANEQNSTECPFCAENFYLKVTNVTQKALIADSAKYCLPCPSNAYCAKNTTIEKIAGDPGYWRHSIQTEIFYKCNHIAGVCLGGTLCAKGHKGIKCEVCEEKNQYFEPSEGKCIMCESLWSKISIRVGLFVGVLVVLAIMRYIAKQYSIIENLLDKFLCALTVIGIQAKIKIGISFYQVVATFPSVYGVRMHSAFTSWFRFLDLFNFGFVDIINILSTCLGSMKSRLLIGAGWPFLVVFLLIVGILIYTVVINTRRLEIKKGHSAPMSRLLLTMNFSGI